MCVRHSAKLLPYTRRFYVLYWWVTDTCVCIYVQWNSLNPASDNPEILIIWHLRRVVLPLEVLLFYYKTASLMKHVDLGNRFKKASKSVDTSAVLVSPNPLSPTPTSSPAKTPENNRQWLWWPWTSRWMYPIAILLWLYSPTLAAVTKITG